MARTYRAADRVVVLSRDMQSRIVAWGVPAERIVCLPNWIDTRQVRPLKLANAFRERHDFNGRFVVMYSGNLGLCQRLEDVIVAADHLRQRPDILFVLVGGGAKEKELKQQALDLGLSNVRFLGYQPKHQLADSLSAAELHLVPLDPRVASCLMPSKLYGVLASGTPLVAVAPDDCELADLTRDHEIGIVTPPGDPAALAAAIAGLADHPDALREMGAPSPPLGGSRVRSSGRHPAVQRFACRRARAASGCRFRNARRPAVARRRPRSVANLIP